MTIIHDNPVMHPNVSNLLEPSGNWGSFTLLDAGGDAIRWARRAFHENQRSYDEVDKLAIQAAAGSTLVLPPVSQRRKVLQRSKFKSPVFWLNEPAWSCRTPSVDLRRRRFFCSPEIRRVAGSAGRPERFVASSGGQNRGFGLK